MSLVSASGRSSVVISDDVRDLSAEARRFQVGCGLALRTLRLDADQRRRIAWTARLNRVVHSHASPDGSGYESILPEWWPPPGLGIRESLWTTAEAAAVGDAVELLARLWTERFGVWQQTVARATVVRTDVDYAGFWRDLPSGEFDGARRGPSYTSAMSGFHVARWDGALTLLRLATERSQGGCVLDVMGGDGYLRRIAAAVASSRVTMIEADPQWPLERRQTETAAWAATRPGTLVVMAPPRPYPHDGAVHFASFDGRQLRTTGPVAIAPQVMDLIWEDAALAADIVDVVAPVPVPIITNDRSAHMFLRAGTCGPSTREAAESLTRTFQPDSCDAVLFAYGTHHLESLDDAVVQAAHILKPGGTIVLHDFLPGGSVARWFQTIVHRYGRVPHDHPHLGPIEMARALRGAGLGEIALYEMNDPFIITAVGEIDACTLAERHVQGMYDLGSAFDPPTTIRDALSATMSYPEIGETPIWTDDYVYLPRRAIVATATKPGPSSPVP